MENCEFLVTDLLAVIVNGETFLVGDLVKLNGTESPVFCITEISQKKYLTGATFSTVKYQPRIKVQKVIGSLDNPVYDYQARVFKKNFPFTWIGARKDLIEK